MDLLNSYLSQGGGNLGFGQTANAIAPGQATGPGAQSSTPLSELVVHAKAGAAGPTTMPAQATSGQTPVTAAAPPAAPVSSTPPDLSTTPPAAPAAGVAQDAQPPTLDYNNSGASQAVNAAVAGEGTPPGGMANPGLYGMLPKSLQHGTLRNVLGALGDALLVSGGKAPAYEDRMQRQEIGQAMAGMDINDPQSVAAATQRVAATGAAGSADMADKLQTQAEQAAQRKQLMEYNQSYRNAVIGQRNDALFNRMYPAATADMSQSTSASDYATRLARWNQRIKAIDPDQDAMSAFAISSTYNPADMTSTAGMTNNQIVQHGDRQSAQATSIVNARIGAGSRIGAAGIEGGAHVAGSRMEADKPTEGTILSGAIARLRAGTADDTDRAIIAHGTQVRSSGRGLAPGLTVGGVKPAAPAFVNGKVYTDAHGNHATYSNGKWIPHK